MVYCSVAVCVARVLVAHVVCSVWIKYVGTVLCLTGLFIYVHNYVVKWFRTTPYSAIHFTYSLWCTWFSPFMHGYSVVYTNGSPKVYLQCPFASPKVILKMWIIVHTCSWCEYGPQLFLLIQYSVWLCDEQLLITMQIISTWNYVYYTHHYDRWSTRR